MIFAKNADIKTDGGYIEIKTTRFLSHKWCVECTYIPEAYMYGFYRNVRSRCHSCSWGERMMACSFDQAAVVLDAMGKKERGVNYITTYVPSKYGVPA